jgi:uncharacterized protein (TIGR03435 family)
MPDIANHLLQSTIFAVATGLLTLLLRNNHARTRYWIWLTASLKFLIPFSIFIELGHRLSWSTAPVIAQQPSLAIAIDTISQPFAPAGFSPAVPVHIATATPSILPTLLPAIWICGSIAVLIFWLIRWRRVAALLRTPGAQLEPGVFGILRPVLYLPPGIADKLDDAQLKAIVAHELCHIRNRDNLTAALHSLVEAIFWFHPLTWWIGARLVEERERACDEEVVMRGSDPEIYAESILKICKLYVESPLTCIPGISGANLKKRIESIMTNSLLARLSLTKKAFLAAAGALALLTPIAIGIVSAPAGHAQQSSASASQHFEIADVHPSARVANPTMSGGVLRIDRYEIHRATMLDLIRTAWSVPADNVVGGPPWLDSDRFDIIAKAPPNTSPETLQKMLQSLLQDRFGLVIRNDTRPLQAYALTVGKRGPQMKVSDGTGDPGCKSQQQRLDSGMISTTFTCRHETMDAFAGFLHTFASGYFGGPVADQTGLKGFWDFEIKFTPRGLLTLAGSDGISLYDAVDKIGLKLDMQTVALPVLVVDRVNEKPTDNAPGVTNNLPAAPTEFEVADIKPSAPGETRGQVKFQPGGRIDGRGVALKDVIMFAWNISSDDMLVGGPKWLDTDLFDVIAKAPATLSQLGSADLDALQPMTRALLESRFKLKVHEETRPVQVYALVAVKPKMAKADPRNRAGCKSTPGAPGASAILSKNYTCTNVTMAEFADKLSAIAPGYMDHPGVDLTGLEGGFDFVLNFSNRAQTMVPATADPNGAITLAEAIDKELGLKLELRKHPMPVLVIDHVEEKPSGN